MKKRMTAEQEFQIMKLVLDKFLWVGIIIMLIGVYHLYSVGLEGLKMGITMIVIGAIILILFIIILVKEYEIIR